MSSILFRDTRVCNMQSDYILLLVSYLYTENTYLLQPPQKETVLDQDLGMLAATTATARPHPVPERPATAASAKLPADLT